MVIIHISLKVSLGFAFLKNLCTLSKTFGVGLVYQISEILKVREYFYYVPLFGRQLWKSKYFHVSAWLGLSEWRKQNPWLKDKTCKFNNEWLENEWMLWRLTCLETKFTFQTGIKHKTKKTFQGL